MRLRSGNVLQSRFIGTATVLRCGKTFALPQCKLKKKKQKKPKKIVRPVLVIFPFVPFPNPVSAQLALPSLSSLPTETGVASRYEYQIFLGASPSTHEVRNGVWIHLQKRKTHHFVHVQNGQNCTVADVIDSIIMTENTFAIGNGTRYKYLYVTTAGGLKINSATTIGKLAAFQSFDVQHPLYMFVVAR
jgi:hypothetical protein